MEGRISLHDQIRKLKQQGKTIILASHDMSEVETLCDRIAILKDGGIAFIGTADQLTSKIGRRSIIHLKTSQGDESFECDDIGDTMFALLEGYKQKAVAVLDIQIDRGTHEQHFIDISRGKGE